MAQRAELVAAALARSDDCAAEREATALVEEAIAAVNAGEVPPAFQEELVSIAQEVAGRIECAAAAEQPPAAPAPPVERADEDDGEGGEDEQDDEPEEADEPKDDEPSDKGRGKKKGKRK